MLVDQLLQVSLYLVEQLTEGLCVLVQGVLTNSHEDINALIAEDFAALAGLLGDKTYFLGPQPSAADACVFGFIQTHTHGPNDTPLSRRVRKHPNLVKFSDNIQKTYFADRLEKGFKLD